jgi:hypothetical protein
MKVSRWVVVGIVLWPVLVLGSAALLRAPWGLALAVAYGPVLAWAALRLAPLGARRLRERAFWSFSLHRLVCERGWRYEAGRVTGAHRERPFELVHHEETVDWHDVPDGYWYATTAVLHLHGLGDLPRTRVRSDEPSEFAEWPDIPGFTTEPGTISAPFTQHTTAGLLRLLDFLAAAGDSLER